MNLQGPRDMQALDDEAGQGLYPISAVAKLTGIGVHTLRAWERRYGLPRPARTAGTHRLYGTGDIALLRRVLHLVDKGTLPSRACALVLADATCTQLARGARDGEPRPSPDLKYGLRDAFIELDEEPANRILSEAFCLLGPELALTEVVLPALREVGLAWEEGRASVSAEHFGSGLIRARLLAAFEGGANSDHRPLALLAAAPGDLHEIPAMVLALMLRRRGWRAILLGSDTPVEAMIDAIQRKKPQLVCVSATIAEHALNLVEVLTRLRHMAQCGSVILSYGGPPFEQDARLREALEGTAVYLGDDLRAAADRAAELLRRIGGIAGQTAIL